MHIRITTSSNIDKWLRRFEKKVNTTRTKIVNEPGKQARVGQQLGKALAPRDTGTLINAISWKVLDKSKTSGTAMIWVRPLQNQHTTANKYATIHHRIGDRGPLKQLPWQKKASTGDFHWMFIVQDELGRRYKKTILDHIGELYK
jgi:hypothetical protein